MNCLSILLAVSIHLGLENEYNNVHPHARCTVDKNIIGAYYNSEYRLSSYIGRVKKHKDLEIEYGIVTGYTGSDIVPMFRIKKDRWFIAPAYETTGNAGFVIGIEFNIK